MTICHKQNKITANKVKLFHRNKKINHRNKKIFSRNNFLNHRKNSTKKPKVSQLRASIKRNY